MTYYYTLDEFIDAMDSLAYRALNGLYDNPNDGHCLRAFRIAVDELTKVDAMLGLMYVTAWQKIQRDRMRVERV